MIYLDNNATTPLLPAVRERMQPYFEVAFGNPSSVHGLGLEAERALRQARRQVARALGVKPREVVFTSGGTEGDNLAMKGAARPRAGRGRHLLTSQAEHPAVLQSFLQLEAEGFEVERLPVDRFGGVSTREVLASVRPDTVLVSVMHVNNETGVINPVGEIAEGVKTISPRAVVHVDGVQALGKVPVDLANELKSVDLYVISGHKVHGPKGSGVVVVRQGLQLTPLVAGGGQEHGLRSGTENVAAIVGLAEAVTRATAHQAEAARRLGAMRQQLVARIEALGGRTLNPPEVVPSTISCSFPGIQSETLLNALSALGVYASPGAACASKKRGRSHVLQAAGLDSEWIDGALRFSFSRLTTPEEVEQAGEALAGALEASRPPTRRGRHNRRQPTR